MPEVGEAIYLVHYWNDLGLITAGPMGPVAISSQEVIAWQQGSQLDLSAWEFSSLIQMSRSYLSSMHLASDPACPPPYGNPINEFDRSVLSKRVSDAFKSLLMARKP